MTLFDQVYNDKQTTCVFLFMSTSLLILTETMLFYHDLSSTGTKKSKYSLIANWATHVQDVTKTGKSMTKRSRMSIPSEPTNSSATLVNMRRTVSSTNPAKRDIGKVQPKDNNHENGSDYEDSCGFLEEGEGEERDAAMLSTVKGSQRLTSDVSHVLRWNVLLMPLHNRLLSKSRIVLLPPSSE